jgi:hypothetical protein
MYDACDTAIPYPGTIITFEACPNIKPQSTGVDIFTGFV